MLRALSCILVLLVTGLVATAFAYPQHRLFKQRNLQRDGAGAPAAFSFCNASTVAAAMSGNWGCTNGDLTEPALSTYDWAGIGSPTPNAGSGTCAAPAFQAISAGGGQYIEASPAKDSVTGAFTICVHGEATASTLVSTLGWIVYPCCGGGYSVTTEQSAALTYYPGGSTGLTVVSGDRFLSCSTYNGSGSTSGYIRTNGDPVSTFVTVAATPSNRTGAKFVFGADSATYGLTGRIYGGFFTETALSRAQLDAIFLQVVECS